MKAVGICDELLQSISYPYTFFKLYVFCIPLIHVFNHYTFKITKLFACFVVRQTLTPCNYAGYGYVEQCLYIDT